jgi:hypothetical protein
MTIIEWFFSPRSQNDWNSWWALTFTLPLFVALAVLVPASLKNAEVGNRQRLASGVVTAYEPSNHNQCRYTFSVQGTRFSGVSSAPKGTVFVGEEVEVYFDPTNPATNSLRDFSATSRGSRGVVFISLAGIFGITGLILYSKTRSHRRRELRASS